VQHLLGSHQNVSFPSSQGNILTLWDEASQKKKEALTSQAGLESNFKPHSSRDVIL